MQTRHSVYDDVYASRRREFMDWFDRQHCLPVPTKEEKKDAADNIEQYAANELVQEQVPVPAIEGDQLIDIPSEWGYMIKGWRNKHLKFSCPDYE